jgi:hypothetical protein
MAGSLVLDNERMIRLLIALILLTSCRQPRADSCQRVREPRLGPVADAPLAVPPPHTLAGVVVDSATHRGLPGVSVVVYVQPVMGGYTDSTGGFIIANVPSGLNRIAVRRIGYTALTDTLRMSDSAGTSAFYILSGGVLVCNVQANCTRDCAPQVWRAAI